jgi:hypothetical protein
MNKINPFKFAWLGLGVLLVVVIISISMFFAKQDSLRKNEATKQLIVPEHKSGKVPGEIIAQFPEPDLPTEEYSDKYNNLNEPISDSALFESDAPLAGNAIKIPDEPALPPSEDDIININILDGNLSVSKPIVERGESIIIKTLSQDKDYYFYIDGVGIAEIIKAEQYLTISFRAPVQETELKYWIEYADTEGATDSGILQIK